MKIFNNWHLLFSLEGTVLRRATLLRQITLLTLYAALLVCLHNYVDGLHINFPLTLVTVVGFVIGLLLVFRTNTSYDRYWEGRKLWSSITHNIRTLIRYVWTVVEEREAEDAVEKITIINLLVAFPFALKNYLREDYSYESENIRDLIRPMPHLAPEMATSSMKYQRGHIGSYSNAAFNSGNDDPVRVSVAMVEQKERRDDMDALEAATAPAHPVRRLKWKAYAEPTKTNIPIEILLHLVSYMNQLATQKNPVPVTFLNAMNASVTALSDAVSGVERILQTPLPVAYAYHLRHTVLIYLMALPYQLIGLLNWWTIPTMTLVSFALLGILHIGTEIENPFGLDDNDLPLDQICERIRHEAILTVSRTMRAPATWIMSTENQPLNPFSHSNAVDLSQRNLEEVHQLLMRRAEVEAVNS